MSVLNFGFHAIDFGFFVSGKGIPNFNRQRDCRFPGLKCWPPKPWIRNSTSKKFPPGRFGLLYMQREVQNNNDLLYVESFCPIKEAGYVVRLYIIPKTFLAGRNSILSLLDTEAKTKGKPTKLVCYCLQSFVYLRHFQTYHSRPRSARGPRKKPSIYRDFERGTQRLFSVKYLFGEANIAQNFLLLEDC